VDKAEEEKDLAFLVNAEAVGVLAAVCKQHNTKLVHISTDYVFDGQAAISYKEDSPANPQSVYGASKLKGEEEALQLNADMIIIRTSWIYSSYGKNFVKTIMKLMKENNELNVVNDQVGSPTYAADLAEVILKIIPNWQPGIYHFSNDGVISWYDFAKAIIELTGSTTVLKPISTDNYPAPTKRPAYSVLDKNKIQKIFGVQIKDWKKSLESCIKKMSERTPLEK
jgi:dTDP-4-dehydrorhamnose reductase